MRHIAIVGSGPAGYYTAEAALKQWGSDVAVDIFDRLPVPYGLIRFGVAPDHQSIKGVSRRYEATALADNVRFLGNVTVGRDVTMAELGALYDAVVLATGAPRDRPLDLPGEGLRNVTGSAAFVGWYNGHPEFAALDPDLSGTHAVVIGMGNVALDVARILAKDETEFAGSDIVAHALAALRGSRIRHITILGRRGPHQISMTPKELGELAHLNRARVRVDPAQLPAEETDALLDPGQRKSVAHLRTFAAGDGGGAKQIEVVFAFHAAPRGLLGAGRVSAIEIEHTRMEGERVLGTGRFSRLPADLVVSCIGYRSVPLDGVPFDERGGRFINDEGWIAPGLYCVGWARRGPSGTIGTNRPDGFSVVERLAGEQPAPSGKPGCAGFDRLARERRLDVVSFDDWKRIEHAEEERARTGAPREKFVAVDDLIRARD